MRVAFSLIFILLIAGLLYCHTRANRSPRAIGKSVGFLLIALVPPLIGNLIIISSTDKTLSTIGCYTYFLGMDAIMLAVLLFTFDYCNIPREKRKPALIAYILLGIDVIQLLLNPFFHHAFATEPILVSGAPYYRLIPFLGQTFHRVVDYGILVTVILIFFVKVIRSPRIDRERYLVILAAMVITAAWETAYIFSRTPVDRAMIGFGVFGLIVYYLALIYRPRRLLDSMLAKMAWEMPDALFFFDANGQCIWANRPGVQLARLEPDNYEPAAERLLALFGDYTKQDETQKQIELDGTARSFVMKKHSVADEKDRVVGSFLIVRDNTRERELLQHEIHKATHDSLTAVYNRAGYDLLLSSLDLKQTYLLLIDADSFKQVNDTCGHEVGDRVLQRIADTVRRFFRAEDYVCRIGGDEFVVFMARAGDKRKQRQLIISRIQQINAALARPQDCLPPITVSAGIAYGGDAADSAELFDHADQALYETKKRGKNGYTFFGSAA